MMNIQRNIGLSALVFLALLAGACSQNTSEVENSGSDSTEVAVAAPDETEIEAVDMMAAPECVVEPQHAICTDDINACGQPSACTCADGYTYNASIGKCLLITEGVGEATYVQTDDNECVKTATDFCTRDINVCGQPSNCGCDEGFAWNDVAGKCLKDLSAE